MDVFRKIGDNELWTCILRAVFTIVNFYWTVSTLAFARKIREYATGKTTQSILKIWE